jgi:hypothetical protein
MQLAIHTPCQQRWQDMNPGETGRFCEHCQKTVVDFAAMSDRQITAYFLNQSQPVCGRLTINQLNRTLRGTPNGPITSARQRWMGLLAAGLLSWTTSQGQTTERNLLNVERIVYDSSDKTPMVNSPQTVITPDSSRVISGRVVDQTTQSSLPGATVAIKGTERGTITNDRGEFSIRLTDNQGSILVLIISAIGFVSQEVARPSSYMKPINVALAQDTAALNQVYVTGYVTVNKIPTSVQQPRNQSRKNH